MQNLEKWLEKELVKTKARLARRTIFGQQDMQGYYLALREVDYRLKNKKGRK